MFMFLFVFVVGRPGAAALIAASITNKMLSMLCVTPTPIAFFVLKMKSQNEQFAFEFDSTRSSLANNEMESVYQKVADAICEQPYAIKLIWFFRFDFQRL
jgi:hypothetical protein